MPNERDSFSALTVRDYDIAGNLLRVYSKPDGDIAFVLDLHIDENKPNVLLVIDSIDNRKWDDILENDYGIELETVRPKKDNKYQKLDIEYSGLDIYRDLIGTYVENEGITDALAMLNAFREIAVRRAAAERLATAETAVENTRETIDKTNETIAELNGRLRQLRARLSDLRKNIGKEPTKQSASKILRTESQIDATNEKIRRAKKRLDNAQKRLVSSIDDAEVAREILERLGKTTDMANVPALVSDEPIATIPDGDLVVVRDAPVPVDYSDQTNSLTINNTKAEDMADEEVKPLFDTDPEILDEEIAFKPIDFNAPIVAPDMTLTVQNEPGVPDTYNDAAAVAPLSFTPPIASEQFQESETIVPGQVSAPAPAPVLDSITAVETPVGMDVVEEQSEFIPKPVTPSYAAPITDSAPMSDVAPASTDSGFRPVSPLTGVAPVIPSSDVSKRKQGVVYYVMLIALIIMSIFVLWYYQKSTGGNALPNIGDKVAPEIAPADDATPVVTEPTDVAPIVEVEEVSVSEPEKVEPVVIEEPVPVEPVVVQPEPEPTPEPVVIEAEPESVEPTEVVVPVSVPVLNTVPTVVPEPETIKVETEEEILAKKPAYGVSQNEAMFVADDEFETDRLDADITDDDVVDMYDTPIIRVQEPEVVTEYIEEGAPMCEGGAAPDRFGCCPGETYTQIDNGGFVCCPDAGGDCFPPLL